MPRRLLAVPLILVTLLAGWLLTVDGQSASAVISSSACQISGPLTPPVPARTVGGSGFPRFIQFQVNNGYATYAGVAQTSPPGSDDLRLVYWHNNQLTFLDTWTETNADTEPIDGTMEAVGFDAQGLVVARVQKFGTSTAYLHSNGWRYDSHGHKWLLQDSPLWTSVEPIAVTGAGVIVGNARYGSSGWGTNQIVEWTGSGRGTVHLLTAKGFTAQAVDQQGDIYYTDDSNGNGYVLRPGGEIDSLLNYQGDAFGSYADGGSVASGFGTAQAGNQRIGARWDVPAGPATALAPHTVGYLVWVDSVGLGGDVVGEYPGNAWPDRGVRVLVRSTGKAYRLPPQFDPPYDKEPHTTTNRFGQVVYTATDGLPHQITCPP